MLPPAKLQRTGSLGGAAPAAAAAAAGAAATTCVSFSVQSPPGGSSAAPPLRLSNSSSSIIVNSNSSNSSSSSSNSGSTGSGSWGVSGGEGAAAAGPAAATAAGGGVSSNRLGMGSSIAAAAAPTAAAAAANRPRFSLYLSSKRNLCCPFCTPSGSSSSSSSSSSMRKGSTIVLDSSSGDQLCKECGFVLEERVLNEEQEWRSFSAENSGGGAPKGSERNRVGEALDGWLQDGGISTSMLIGGGSMSKGLGSGRRLQILHEAATGSAAAGETGNRDRQLRAAFSYLRLIAEAFSLRDYILERGKEIAKELLDAGQLRSRSTAVSMLAITYLACREAGATRTVKELVVYDRSITEKELDTAADFSCLCTSAMSLNMLLKELRKSSSAVIGRTLLLQQQYG
ncbi:transcription initiation factor iib, putative [Eimeria acervulina]|uniref:General transcription factor TFIIB n=1 Tax=Eimeria acervulina TaxID=5801 RepID=U6GH13_EIMAC|nr:transcription initiation factor iib, putative [Eimeria acervulina]CDI79511.1 transcription initiation factor iib, putative [Eimeria acervulina]